MWAVFLLSFVWKRFSWKRRMFGCCSSSGMTYWVLDSTDGQFGQLYGVTSAFLYSLRQCVSVRSFWGAEVCGIPSINMWYFSGLTSLTSLQPSHVLLMYWVPLNSLKTMLSASLDVSPSLRIVSIASAPHCWMFQIVCLLSGVLQELL